MPVPVSYPGVYVEEIPSGVRTITGVATSISAFVGWAPKGPTDRAQLVLSWSDFDRQFGGLDARSLLGYSVSQFFINGGQQAYVIRLAAGNADVGHVDLGATDPQLEFPIECILKGHIEAANFIPHASAPKHGLLRNITCVQQRLPIVTSR